MKIFLTGFMGSGKTYWGRAWAQQEGLAFYDLDEVIVNAEGQSIDSIFEKSGEPYFRKTEAAQLRRFAGIDNCIIACGGGTPCFEDNMAWMNANGITVYLRTTPQYVYERVLDEKDKRPLIKKLNAAELLFFIEQKMKEREPFYSQAQLQFGVTDVSLQSIKEILQAKS